VTNAAPDIDRTLAALADPYRRRTVDLLREGSKRASDIARALELTPPVMSRHLRVLRQSGIVREEHPEFDARVRIYSLQPGAIHELNAWLDQVEAMWTQQLSAFKAHILRSPPDQSGGIGSN
jgi:DNA-binding transcriptional ArsR family regulator